MHLAPRRAVAIGSSWRQLMACMLAVSGCVAGAGGPDRFGPIAADRRAALRARSEERFASARFWKPRTDLPEGLETFLAPLIVEQAGLPSSDTGVRNSSFGAVVLRRDGSLAVDTTERVIYAHVSEGVAGPQDHVRAFYLWAYPGADGTDAPRWRAVRATLGPDGFPLVWEVYQSELRERHLFVAASLEPAVTPKEKVAAAGSVSSLERAAAETPGSVVIGVFEDGPVPMGPYVLLSSGTRDVTTLYCRCSPSHVDAFVESGYYDVAPVESLPSVALAWLPPAVDLPALLGRNQGTGQR